MTDKTPEAVASTDKLGVAVLANGRVVAWFAEFDDYAHDFCTENWFGCWLTWRVKRPEIVPLTPEEQAKCDEAAREIRDALRVE